MQVNGKNQSDHSVQVFQQVSGDHSHVVDVGEQLDQLLARMTAHRRCPVGHVGAAHACVSARVSVMCAVRQNVQFAHIGHFGG